MDRSMWMARAKVERFLALAVMVSACSVSGCSGSSQDPSGSRAAATKTNDTAASGGSNTSGGSSSAIGSPNAPMSSSSGTGGATTTTTTDAGLGSNLSARDPISIDECGANNPAGISDQDAQALMAGGAAGSMRWLYPYADTVFPRGMLPPTLMWDGAPGDVVYVHIHAMLFDYRGCLNTTGPQQLEIPQAIWKSAGDQTLGPVDPFTIELTVLGASGPVGPIAEKIIIAQATIKGSLFYNSYVTSGSNQGVVFRIPPGGQAAPFLGGGGLNNCYGCHSVSANGERLIAHVLADPGSSYVLTPTTQPNPPAQATILESGFVGLSPDGLVHVASSRPGPVVFPQGVPLEPANDAALYDTDTGAQIPNSGIPAGAMMPMFSPDGTLIAFNDYNTSQGRDISIMDYDASTRTFSNERSLFTDSNMYPGWPFFLPDNGALIFARGSYEEFSGRGIGVAGAVQAGQGPASDLYILDIASGTSTLLARGTAMNSPQDPTSFTAFGDADLHNVYYPTVSPVAAGGYFWVFYDAIRNYGNMGVARQLWGSAILISPDGTYQGDPSNPPFFITGQEFGTGNHRAFTALDPCKKDGDSCLTGIDCCGGSCYFADKSPTEFETDQIGSCSPPPPNTCVDRDGACLTDADCCNMEDICLNGFCGQVITILQ